MNITDEDFARQSRWEMEGYRRAAERYREAAKARDPATLPSGLRLLREVIPPLIGAIEATQAAAVEQLGTRGREPRWAAPMLLLGAEKLAVITATIAVRAGQSAAASDSDQPLSDALNLSLAVAQGVCDQLEFDRWESAQKDANKAAQDRGDPEHQDQLAAFRSRYPNAGRRSWDKWRRKMDIARSEKWDKHIRVQVGGALLALLAEAAPKHFELSLRHLPGGKTQRYLKLSDDTLALMGDIEQRAAISRPQLMPMIIPPLPWRYSDDDE